MMPSVETMEKLLHWANVAYIGSLVIAAFLTFAIYHLSKQVTKAKDRELAQYQADSQVKIAAAETSAAEAETRAAEAEARAADANLAAKQAQLELAKFKEPRTIAPEDQERIIADLKEFTGQKYSVSVFPDPEALALLRVVDAMLKSAGWVETELPNRSIKVNAAGITAATSVESGMGASVGRDDGASAAALRALSDSLRRAGIPCRRGIHPRELQEKSPNTILIFVGKKPYPKE